MQPIRENVFQKHKTPRINLALFLSDIYLRQGGYVFAWVCLWVCEFVCEQDNSKTYGWIFNKIFRICLKR